MNRFSIITERLKNPFKYQKNVSTRSKVNSEKEMDPELFFTRIATQILDMENHEYPYSTPEEWDSGFYKLGGGQSRRKSTAILERMTWDQFLYNTNEFLKSCEKSRDSMLNYVINSDKDI